MVEDEAQHELGDAVCFMRYHHPPKREFPEMSSEIKVMLLFQQRIKLVIAHFLRNRETSRSRYKPDALRKVNIW